jgi:hypothetical protein
MKSNLNPPCPPFSKEDFSAVRFNPLFDKEGKGRFSDETDMANNSANFWDRTLVGEIRTRR